MVILKPEMVPVKINRKGDQYISSSLDNRFKKSVTVINESDNYSLRVWQPIIGEYTQSLGKISKEEAHEKAESKLRALIQDSSKKVTWPWLKGLY